MNWLNIWKCERLCAHGDVHIHARTHTLLPLPGWYHYPSLYPQFAISQPNRSHPINVFDFGQPINLHLTPSASLFFTPYNISLCLTTLTQLSPANKLHQFPNYLNIQLLCARWLLVLCYQTIFMCCWKTPALQHVLISCWPLTPVCIWHFCNS